MVDLVRVEDARGRILACIPRALPAEPQPVVAARGRVLAEPVIAATDLPPWDNSAMDGYAVRAADVAGASQARPVRLAVAGEVAAGQAPAVTAAHGVAVRIATGAPMPPGADAVVQVELTTPLDGAGVAGPRGRHAAGPLPAEILVHAGVEPGSNVRTRGGDVRAGSAVLAAGTAIGPVEVAMASGSGVAVVVVHRRPRVTVISTGDELRPAGAELGPAGIPDSNGPSLVALSMAAGAEARHLGIAPDDLPTMISLLREAIAEADLVVVSGGVSVGPYDVVRPAFEVVGTVELWRVAVQPGKPFAFGTAPRPGAADAAAPVLLLGLPGNPVSTFVTFELFVRPALRRLAGRLDTDLLRPTDVGVLDDPVVTSPGRRAFIRVVARRERPGGAPLRDPSGRVRVGLTGEQSSHVISGLAAADALAVVPESVDALPAGAPVELWWLDRP